MGATVIGNSVNFAITAKMGSDCQVVLYKKGEDKEAYRIPFENAQVCSGGIPLKEVTDQLESIYCKNIYITGEILDCDGICGGYNLQWAWATGVLAGRAAVQ